VLIGGRSKTGKTREAVELLRRWWYSGPTVLLAKNHVGLYPPYRVPDTLPVRNLVLFFDDVDRYCGDADAVKRLDQTIAFFVGLCREPGELRVIATARQEPEFWDKLHYDEAVPPWATFKMVSLLTLSSDGARQLIDDLARNCGMDADPAAAEDMAIKNDGTFLNLVPPFRGSLHEDIKQIGPEQEAASEGNLVTTWRRRRLLATEVSLRGGELRPYEGQFEGNGTSRTWHPTFFAGQGSTAAFRRLTAPRLAAIYWTWAEELRAAGELGPARSLARLASVLAPNHPTPPFMLGKLWHDAGDFRRALAEFARSRALNPTTSAALALERIAWSFYHLEEYERAENAAGQALILMPDLSAARWAQGLARLQRGQSDAGLSNCRQAALAEEMPPPDLGAALAIALAGEESRDWATQVSRLLRRGASPKTKRTALWRRVKWGLAVGLVLVSVTAFLFGVPYVSRNLEENTIFGVHTMDVLLEFYPYAPALLTHRGYIYTGLGDYERAIADYTEAIRLAPEFAVAYNNRGYAYDNLGNYEQAIADYTEAIRLNPENAAAYTNRGHAYKAQGDLIATRADWERAVELYEAQGQPGSADLVRSLLSSLDR